MIIEALVNMLVFLVKSVANLFDKIPLPSFWANVDGWLQSVAGYASGMGNWVPWTVVMSAVAFVFACMAVALTIRLIRVLISAFTGGGGSAA